jgi:hypothetical protein
VKRYVIRFCLAISLVWALAACGNVATSAPVVEPPASTSVSSSAVFQIVKADGTKFDVTLDALKKLPLANITVDGKVQEGPKLLDVLNLAGVTDFKEIALSGSSSPATLTRAQVDDNTILDFNNHGTVKLATTYIPMPDWTKDVSLITVK